MAVEDRPAGPWPNVAPVLDGWRVLDALQGMVAVVDPQGTVVWTNRSWQDHRARHGPDAGCLLAGASLFAGIDRPADDRVRLGLGRVLAGEVERFEVDASCPVEGTWYSVRFNRTAAGHAVLTCVDVTERRRAVQVLQAQSDVLALVAGGADLATCAHRMAESIEALTPGTRAMILAFGPDRRLQVLAAPHLPSAWRTALHGHDPRGGPGWSLPRGEVEPVVAVDLGADPQWAPLTERIDLADSAGFWWTKVRGDCGEPIGAVGLVLRQAAEPTDAEADLMRRWAELVGLTIGRRRQDEALAASRAETTAVLQAAADGILVVGADRVVRSANPQAETLLGRAPGTAVGTDVDDLIRLADPATTSLGVVGQARHHLRLEATGRAAPSLAAPAVRLELDVAEHAHLDGWLTTLTLRPPGGRSDFEARLAHQASHDALTGLPNRSAVVDALTALGTPSPGPVVLAISVDRLDVVNDSFGHDGGNRLLIATAERLRAALPDHLVGRLAGDEFGVVAAGDDVDLAALVALVTAVVGQPLDMGGRHLVPTVSIGVSGRDLVGPVEDLLEEAESALTQAKSAGAAQVRVYDAAARSSARARLELEADVASALEGDQLHLAYQPQVVPATGEIVGAEALIRWRHPVRGPVPPDEWIGVAEDTGSIVAVGAWVLRTALAQAASWRRELGRPLGISVNVSARQLERPGLPDLVASCLRDAGVDPGMLCLELTETAMVDGRSIEVLKRLKALGVRISLDDFGVGYSSLDYLRRFPVVDELKIDRAFTAGVGRNQADGTVTEAVVTLAHGLGMTAVAEGVEDPEQLAVLIGLGCDLAQGYHLGRPMPAADLLALARRPAPG